MNRGTKGSRKNKNMKKMPIKLGLTVNREPLNREPDQFQKSYQAVSFLVRIHEQ